MQENIQRYHPLGVKTLFMFILKRTVIIFLLMPGLIAGAFFLNKVPKEFVNLAVSLISIYLFMIIFATVGVFFFGWLAYYRYWIFIDDKDLKIARGLIATEQIGVPYRRIQDIKINRSLLDQIVGVSDVVVTVIDPDSSETDDKSTIVLPSVDKAIAVEIQDIVLKKAQVEQINVLGGQRIQ